MSSSPAEPAKGVEPSREGFVSFCLAMPDIFNLKAAFVWCLRASAHLIQFVCIVKEFTARKAIAWIQNRYMIYMRFWWTLLFYMSKIDQCCQNNLQGRLKVANEGWEVPDMTTASRQSSKQTVSDLELAFRCRNTTMHDDLLQLCRSELVKPRVPTSCIESLDDLSWYKWLKLANEPCRGMPSHQTLPPWLSLCVSAFEPGFEVTAADHHKAAALLTIWLFRLQCS